MATVSLLTCFNKAFVKDTWYLNKLLLYYSNNSTEITATRNKSQHYAFFFFLQKKTFSRDT